MKTKEITLCGKQVMVAYCFATEIAFKKFTGVNIDEFDATNPEHIIYLIIAAIATYYQKQGTDAPVKDNDMMYDAQPNELISALTDVLNLRADWYQLPKGEQTDDKPDPDRKRRKQKNA
jgi:hypothetical protein